jgi:hypothetical protein
MTVKKLLNFIIKYMSDLNLKIVPNDEIEEKDTFQINHIQNDIESSSKIKIKFGKFVELVAKHSYVDVIEKNADHEIVIDANLLADLANSHDDEEENPYQKWILIGIGLVVGIFVAYLVLK